MNQNIIKDIIIAWEELTADINDAIGKPELKTAAVSHLKLQFPEVAQSFIEQTIDLIYLSDHL